MVESGLGVGFAAGSSFAAFGEVRSQKKKFEESEKILTDSRLL